MGIREEERRKKIRNTEREKQDIRGEKDRALEGTRQKERKEGKRYAMKMKEGEK